MYGLVITRSDQEGLVVKTTRHYYDIDASDDESACAKAADLQRELLRTDPMMRVGYANIELALLVRPIAALPIVSRGPW